MGGEKIPANAPPLCPVGSPPRGRGKGCGGSGCCRWLRITPAWAGKRATPTKTGCPGGDHPRVGGEKVMCNSRDGARLGSPPRGRGKAAARATMPAIPRITPAWAGKRDKPALILRVVKDHPRVGGEKSHAAPVVRTGVGSPPRGRGKGWGPGTFFTVNGITPAWAGKRARRPSWSYGGGDHPRVGGEKIS